MSYRTRFAWVLAILGLNLVILAPLPWQAHAVAAYMLAVPVTGYLLISAMRLERYISRAEKLLFAMGSGYALSVTLLLLLSYLPGGVHRWHVLLGYDLLSALSIVIAAMQGHSARTQTTSQPPTGAGSQSNVWLWLAIASIVLVAGLLRLPGLGYSEFQDDEVSVMWHAAEVIQGREDALFVHDKGPAEILITTSGYALSDRTSEASARLPFALANLTALLALFWLGWRMFNPVAGWAAAMLLAVDGYFVGFSRIVQYQSVVFLMIVLVVGILYLYMRQPRMTPRLLYLAALFFATGVLAHFEAILVVLPGTYFLVRALQQQDSSLRRTWRIILPALLALSLLLLFYVPFGLHPRFTRTFGEITGNRIGTGFPYNNLADFFTRTIIYSSTYYFAFVTLAVAVALVVVYRRTLPRWLFWPASVLILLALGSFFFRPDWLDVGGTDYAWLVFSIAVLPALAGPRINDAERATWLWFSAAFILALFFTQKPRTHVYDFFIPMALIVGSVVSLAWQKLDRRVERPAAYAVALPLAGAVIMLFAGYTYWMFAYNQVEVLRTWDQNRPAAYWTPMEEARQNAIFGFPFKNGWKVVGALYADGTLDAPFARNGKRGVSNWYTRFSTECSRDAKYFVFTPWNEPTNKGLTDPPRRPTADEGYRLIHVVTVNDETRLEIFEKDSDAVQPPEHHDIADYDSWFDLHLSDPIFEAPGPAGWTNIQHPLAFRLGDSIWLRGYSLENKQPRRGERVDLTLYWQADARQTESYKVFTQIIDPESAHKAGQRDGVPACEQHPTDRWLPGDMIVDRYSIAIADDAPPGDYSLQIGMYDDEHDRLEFFGEDGQVIGDSLGIDTITVVE